jgi:hypothetical protein
MKTIQAVSIWDNGQGKEATILNAYAVNVTLNSSATFWYGLFSANEDGSIGGQLAQGNITMSGADYDAWQDDLVAWEFIATSLNLTITGDYVAPAPIAPEEEVIEEATVVEEPAAVVAPQSPIVEAPANK